MPRFCLVLLLSFIGSLSLSAPGQTTEDALRASLQKGPWFIREGMDRSDLKFDANGQILGNHKSPPFSVSGLQIRQVKLHKDNLEIGGTRVGLVFDAKTGKPHWEAISIVDEAKDADHITLHIAAPANGDYKDALNRIFAGSFDALPPSDAWKPFLIKLSGKPPAPIKKVASVGSNVKPPALLKSNEPTYTPAARFARLNTVVVIRMVVGEDGLPRDLVIEKPAGLGLDEAALDAVRTYQFRPAEYNGNPIAVRLAVEVKFEVW